MYYNLQTKPFLNKIYTKQNINYQYLKDCLKQCYSTCCFSTFPYFVDKLSSSKSLKEYSSGNCVTLSMCLQNILKENNIISYLIPATIPNMYKRPNYLDISHVALAVPIDQVQIFILDPAFYFIDPILINLKTKYTTYSRSSSIYDDSVSIMKCTVNMLTEVSNYNKYQYIPKNTFICECNYLDNVDDRWRYFLREIINPDKAISTFFINIIKYPHITTTYLDNNGICKMHIYIKFINEYEIKISEKHQELYRGLIKDIPLSLISYINPLIKKFFNHHISYHLNILQESSSENYDLDDDT